MPACLTSVARLLDRLDRLADVGAIEGGGVCRIALTDADRAGRDLVAGWMREIGLEVSVDPIGNILGILPGYGEAAAVMMGSHIDTVATGGRYDGNLGVLAALEVLQTVREQNLPLARPLAVGVFTNEEGVRFAPDMMGSLVFAGGLPLDDALAVRGVDGALLGEELRRIGYAGEAPLRPFDLHAYVELHIEQGPVLEAEQVMIGAVERVQGISWTEYTVRGQSNHAGTTPMALRRDAGQAAFAIADFVRRLADEMGGDQVGTVGRFELDPNLVNVVARRAVFTVDLRNTDDHRLMEAEARVAAFAAETAAAHGAELCARPLVRLAPVEFDPAIVDRVEAVARALGHSVRRMPSGAGHDAQMIAPLCPSGMVFIPSVGGISHNVREYSTPEQIAAGLQVLERVVLDLAQPSALSGI